MATLWADLFDPRGFPARWHCGSWSDLLGWLHISSDVAIFLAYLMIPAVLVRFASVRPDLPFRKLFWLFGAFIVSCGLTHLLEAVIFWHPLYRLAGVLKLVTAVISWGTVVALVPLVPLVLGLKTPLELEGEVQRATRELAESEAAYRQAFQHTPVGMAYVSLAGRWLWTNDQLATILGYSPEELRARTFQQLTHPDDLTDDLVQVESLLRGEVPRYSLEKRYIRKDGTTLWAKLSVTLLRTASGAPKHFVAVVDDISREKDLARQIAANSRELQANNRDLRNFVDTVSHDLRGPVRAIAAYSSALEEDHGSTLVPGARELLLAIRRNAARIGEMLEALLRLATYTRRDLDISSVDCRALVTKAWQTLTANGQPRATLEIGELPPALADEPLLQHVWENLLGNALKYSEREAAPHIRVSAERSNDEIRFSVEDNGVGFNQEHAAQIFGVFKRLHGSEFEGSGVGLAVVERVIERHGGSLGAEGKEGEGARFWFTLKAAV